MRFKKVNQQNTILSKLIIRFITKKKPISRIEVLPKRDGKSTAHQAL